MKKDGIKIYLKYPLGISECSYYKYLVTETPEEYEYINKEKSKGIIESKNKKFLVDILKEYVRKIIRTFIPFLPNAHFIKSSSDFDLIHCAHCLSLNNMPWVCDIEWVGQFWIVGTTKNHPNKYFVKKILENKNCKKILAWTEWAKEEIIKEFPEIKDKVEVVYPGIPIPEFQKKRSDKINLLFVSRKFYFKGGLYAVEVMDKLTKKYDNVYGTIISDVPGDVLKKYSDNKKIKFLDKMPQKKLFEEIYPKTNILVYPSFTDTFGFAITEAMSFGIPAVSVDAQSRKELIEDGKTGFIVEIPGSIRFDVLGCGHGKMGFIVESPYGDCAEDEDSENLNQKNFAKQNFNSQYSLYCDQKIVDNLIKKVSILIDDPRLRDSMSENCMREIREGKFSIKERNNKLKRIYKEALR